MRRSFRILILAVVGTFLVVAVALTAARVPFSSETLRQRVVATLSTQLDGSVELSTLTLRLYPELHVVGTGLAIRHRGRRDVPPLIRVKEFTVDASWTGLWRKHVRHVNLEGLDVEIPPKDHQPSLEAERRRSQSPVHQVVVDEVVADNAQLVVLPRDADGHPKVWAMHELHVERVGVGQNMPFRSVLTNGVPPGDVSITGFFGPWAAEEPGDTPLGGGFVLDHADLSVFKGISGMVAAHGAFSGTLDTIDVKGETDTPDFMVSISGHPIPLKTKYHAIVDATNGDTRLEEVDATFLNTSVVARGGVYDVKGISGRLVKVSIDMGKGRIEDVMRMAIHTPAAPMIGALALTAGFELPPGDRDVVEKLRLNGTFRIVGGSFTNADVQKKINDLSRRASNKMKDPEPPAKVRSDFAGRFALGNGTLTIGRVTFNIPGALVDMSGTYGLRAPEPLAFTGNVFMDAKISQTTTGFKSLLLKIVDPLFRHDGRTVIPIHINGTRSDPSFGVDVKRVFKRG